MPTGPSFDELFDLFAGDRPLAEVVAADEVPPPYDGLLVHPHHMTVTVEAYHGDSVDVTVLDRRRDGDVYARKILLVTRAGGRVVQFGIVRIALDACPGPVREAIVAARTPVGRVLVESEVLRRIDITAFLQVGPSPILEQWFGAGAAGRTTFGRLGVIHVDGRPTVEVLEIVAPE